MGPGKGWPQIAGSYGMHSSHCLLHVLTDAKLHMPSTVVRVLASGGERLLWAGLHGDAGGEAGFRVLGWSCKAMVLSAPQQGILSEVPVSLLWAQFPCNQAGCEGEWHAGSQFCSDLRHVGIEGHHCLAEISMKVAH